MPKILIVNDDPASLFALASLLSRWAEDNGCTVLTARSGEEALRRVPGRGAGALIAAGGTGCHDRRLSDLHPSGMPSLRSLGR